MNYDNIMRALRMLDYDLAHAGVSEGDWCLVGSIVLWLVGLRDDVGDIDFFITRDGYDKLLADGWDEKIPNPDHPPMLEKHLYDIKANGWYEWGDPEGPIDAQRVITHDCESLVGWPAMKLTTLRDWKRGLSDPKHAVDVAALDEYLG